MTQELLAKNIILLLKGICWHNDARSTWDPFDGRLRITFSPHPGDLRFLMGEGGRCIKGLQHVAAEIGRRNDYSVSISLMQAYQGNAEKEDRRFEQNVTFDHDEIVRIASGLLASALGRQVDLKVIRKNDRLDLKTEVLTVQEDRVITALNEPLYAYGFRQGCIIKLSTLNSTVVV